jgi:hypothetical protein
MKKIILIVLISFCFATVSFSQNYNTGIGLRGGFSSGLTIKHFVSSNSAIEAIIATRWQGLELTGLYEFHHSFFDAESLNWYIGFGGHVGFWNGDHSYWGEPGTDYTVAGVDGILGIEYSFRTVPINIGIDWKPELNLIGYTGFWADGGALSIRYIF